MLSFISLDPFVYRKQAVVPILGTAYSSRDLNENANDPASAAPAREMALLQYGSDFQPDIDANTSSFH